MEITSREEAKALGAMHYYTGKQCINGHISKHYVASYGCVECLRLSNRAKKDLKLATNGRKRSATARAEAEERGDKFYSTGLPCKHGHFAKRRVSNHCCTECERPHHRSK